MTVTASSPISLTDLHAEFGGTGPITDYYRGGGLVPSTRAAYYTYGSYSSDQYDFFAPIYYIKQRDSDGKFLEINWNGPLISGGNLILPYTHTAGGYLYEKTTIGGATGGFTYYRVKRAVATLHPLANINTSVPTSGEISLTDFYSSVAS